jgi:type I restriction-modification system DNA methylase subunit
MNPIEQKKAAKDFVARWKEMPCVEEEHSRSFWIELLADVLGVANPTRALEFERKVKGRKIDVFYEDMGILVEMKGRGISLDKASERSKKAGEETPYQQAKWYADNLPYSIRPRWIITCNFDEFRIYDQDKSDQESYVSFQLDELPEQVHLLSFFTNKNNSRIEREKELSVQAGELVGKLYAELSKQYKNIDTDPHEQRSLNILIVRLVFLLYAEDSSLLHEKDALLNYLRNFKAEQMRQAVIALFAVLDTPKEARDPYLAESLLAFPYVNGGLFGNDDIIVPQFTEEIRLDLLLNASRGFDWSDISPTIFGAAFESTLNPETRRSGGMHYTSIENIHKVIDPLFLDSLKAELAEIEGEDVAKTRRLKLQAFQRKLANITVFDPACGSGNFLTESYLSLRKLENRVIEGLQGDQSSLGFDGDESPIKVSINQFYGIEINDFAVSVAKTALWIAEEQMMEATAEIVLQVPDFLPLKSNSNIHEGNALRMDWNDVLPAEECSYICGNPPFIGARFQTKEQKQQVLDVFDGARNAGNIDYCGAWYMLAARYTEGAHARCALVSTNSICQGEQVANLWKPLWDVGVRIDFAHDTFRWDNEASDQAHVFCVIVGFSREGGKKRLYHHEKPDAAEALIEAGNINAYLADAPDAFIWSRGKPLCEVPEMGIGNKPIDGGNYLFTKDEMEAFIAKEPGAETYFHPWLGSKEFLHRAPRYCLWLGNVTFDELASLPACRARIDAVREFRLASKSAPTRKLAEAPQRFHVENMPEGDSILIPEVSSERRHYVPMGFVGPETLCSNLVRLVPNATLYHFGVLHSQMHNAWMRTVAGRLKSDYRYSAGVVYNNFVWPEPSDAQREEIEQCAQGVLDARDAHPGATLADLYDPDKMPADLLAAHKALDAAVEAAYGVDFNGDEEKIVAHLFKLYAEKVGNE